MRSIILIALTDLTTEAGQRIRAGQTFAAAPLEAAVLRYRKQVDFAPRPSTPAPTAPIPPIAARHTRKS